jgi:omega-6 fatty acid desaturase (delta-12 desaturase)
MYTNLAILAIIVAASLTMGLRTYLLIQIPVMLVAGTIGVWLFYIQHQYDGVYWARNDAWDPMKASLEGSSFYQLPKVLQWITGNIGFHHVHHVSPRIPNYNLQSAWQDVPQLKAIEPLTMRKSLDSLHMNLWDEKKQKLVSFRSIAAMG